MLLLLLLTIHVIGGYSLAGVGTKHSVSVDAAVGVPPGRGVPAAAILPPREKTPHSQEVDMISHNRQHRSLLQAGCSEVASVRLLLRWLRQAQFAGYVHECIWQAGRQALVTVVRETLLPYICCTCSCQLGN
jgi:hypothetical protein